MNSEITWIKGKDLLSVKRLDLMAKYIYVESYLSGHGKAWAKELYSKHIEAFSGGGFREPGNAQKNSLDAYISSFDHLIEEISQNGFDGGGIHRSGVDGRNNSGRRTPGIDSGVSGSGSAQHNENRNLSL